MTASIPISSSFDPDRHEPFLCHKFKRRCPINYFYIPIECPFMLQCADGRCPLSHTVFEVIFHPILHKTKKCSLAVKNKCKFEKKCAFYHGENDRLGAYLSWLVWEKNWEMNSQNTRQMLQKFGLSSKIISKVILMINTRICQKSSLSLYPEMTDYIKVLEDELNDLISTCQTSLDKQNKPGFQSVAT
ncbi:hypothetical protein TpMuguga_01g00890 [Theileria parva strain Muguga]|uniref:C3H1-type domain-containing protein n=1 Tax=Theileria parva TaxID=5875 RepID=Q4N7D0_THEPA|nr:uncharacterized protein TpMuguga_01g00890 [Theileria parva strain Muguga]EAN34128.1 hypothetical protein TpMuguga_01g00890 [Theileria parva strain Muguga]|eukprot:XP_766411.1 hypothetical protein [Theileria parva strain Muguga]